MSKPLIPFKISYCMETLEEFHSGDGLGKAGYYDDGQQAEYNDSGERIPIIRDDTVSGLLKDSCRLLQHSGLYQNFFSQKYPGISLPLLFDGLFDYGFNDSLMISSLRPTHESLNNFQRRGWPLFVLNSATAIDNDKRRAQKASLRTFEYGASGLRLEGAIWGRIKSDQYQAAKQFLQDGLGNLKRLGGGRRRGSGALNLLAVTSEEFSSAPVSFSCSPPLSNTSTSLYLILEALEPIHIGVSGQIANLMPSLDYLPGQTLLGAFRHEFRVELADRLDPPQRQEVARLFEDLSPVSFGPSYPYPSQLAGIVCSSPPVLPKPAPLAWRYFKDPQPGEDLGYDVFQDEPAHPEESAKRLEGFYFLKSKIYRQSKESVMRNQINPATGRVEEKNLFTTEYIPAHTRFVAEIRFPSPEMCQLFKNAFNDWLQGPRCLGIGRSRKPLKIVGCSHLSATTTFNEQPPKSFVLHLGSDTILHTPALTYYTDLHDHTQRHNWPYHLKRSLVWTRQLHHYTPIGGLPGFPMIAIGKGSAFLFEWDEQSSPETVKTFWQDLKTLELTGNIGAGRIYGWGRFWLAQPQASLNFEWVTPRHPVPSDGLIQRERLLDLARKFVDQHRQSLESKDAPSKSQWGRLAELIQTSAGSPLEIIEEVKNKLKPTSHWKKKISNDGTEIIGLLLSALTEFNDPNDQQFFLEGLVRWLQLPLQN